MTTEIYYLDKQSGRIVTCKEMLSMVDDDDQLHSFIEIKEEDIGLLC